MTLPPGLVIFDCDGVLVDTETIANSFLARHITEAGLPVTMEQCRRRFVGLSMATVRQRLLDEDRIDLGVDFAERWNAQLPEVFDRDLQAIPHVETAIKAVVAAGIPICVASSGRVEKMRLTLGKTGLLRYFDDVLFSASMVERGKPFPDLFLHAARQMGHAPADCAVIEDSVAGAEAAVAAGMTVFGYCGDPLSDAEGLACRSTATFPDMRQLPDLLNLR